MKRLPYLWMVLCVAAALGGRPALAQNDKDPDKSLYEKLAERSSPVHMDLKSLTNPWGEWLVPLDTLPDDFAERLTTAAQVYSDQKVRYDGYLGGDDDGQHYDTAADGLDNAYYADDQTRTYNMSRNGAVDDLKERTWICLDYPMHAVSLAGFPLREAMIADWSEGRVEYTRYGGWPENQPNDLWYFRRVINMVYYLRRKQQFWEERITQEQYRDPKFRPVEAFRPGDIVIMGHYGDDDTLSEWFPKHSGIVKTVDERGLPVEIFDMRVSSKMVDKYDGVIDQTRPAGEGIKFFKFFSDRYSLYGHGRFVHAFQPPAPPGRKPLKRIDW